MTDAPKPDTAPITAANKTTALHSLHLELGGKMVPFAGYDMPVHYPSGIMAEHLHTREKAGLFDVSHMGQAYLTSLQGSTDVAVALEGLVPGILATLKPGAMRYTLLLNDEGGILDDLMVTRRKDGEDGLFLVVNAGPKDSDFAHISKKLEGRAQLHRLDDRALLALQGPKAAAVLADIAPDCATLSFMEALWTEIDGIPTIISRSGYTGEDGFEISILRNMRNASPGVCWPMKMWPPSVLAHAIRCVWKRACAFMDMISIRQPHPWKRLLNGLFPKHAANGRISPVPPKSCNNSPMVQTACALASAPKTAPLPAKAPPSPPPMAHAPSAR